MLDKDFIESVLESDLDPCIKQAREMNKALLLHVEGIGLDEYLQRINKYENEGQHAARIKHSISNKFVTEELLRPVDNAFQATGGSVEYKFKTDEDKKIKELEEHLKNIKNGSSVYDYIENVWFNKFIVDPNGLIFVETSEDGENIYPCYKSIQDILLYEQNGQCVDWVIFEPHKKEKEGKDEFEVFWVVDKEGYYLYKKSKEGVKLLDEIKNKFEKVPAFLCSNIIDHKTGWKKSPIDGQIELLNKYLVSNSILPIVEFSNIYARGWEYSDDCKKCSGTGIIGTHKDRDGNEVNDLCDCDNGRYQRKDVTDILRLKVPQGDQQNIAPPAGWIEYPSGSWQLQVDSIDRYFDLLINSQWGATKEKKDNETATGRWIDVQPVNNRLSKYSKSIEMAHGNLVDLYGIYYFPETYQNSTVKYGRRYLIETPDQIWEKYLKAKTDKAPISTLDLLLYQYYESEFKDNPEVFVYNIKKIKLEPFVHWDISIVRESEYISDIDKLTKEYFNEWIKEKDISYIAKTEFEVLKNELLDYVNNKQPKKEEQNEDNEQEI